MSQASESEKLTIELKPGCCDLELKLDQDLELEFNQKTKRAITRASATPRARAMLKRVELLC